MEFSSPFFIRWKVDSPKDFDGFSQTQSQYEEHEEVLKEDEKALAAFMSDNVGPRHSLVDLIIERIREKMLQLLRKIDPFPHWIMGLLMFINEWVSYLVDTLLVNFQKL